MSRTLIIGSNQPYSGKSATVLGLAKLFRQHHFQIMYGKPIGSCTPGHCPTEGNDEDLTFMITALGLPPDRLPPMVARMDPQTILNHLQQDAPPDLLAPLRSYCQTYQGDVLLLEGPADLQEGFLFHLSLADLAQDLAAAVLLITRFPSPAVVDSLLAAQHALGSRLTGVLFNDVAAEQEEMLRQRVIPFLEGRGMPVFGVLPSDRILRSISVAELVNQLQAQVLCCGDHADEILIETFVIGAMSVNSALKYFRRSEHKAVITGGDRTDIQLAALETGSACLILTGQHSLDPRIQQRAEELEIPILLVEFDTFTTSERIERVFGQVRLQERVKVQCIETLMSANFDFSRFCQHLGLTPSLASARA
ncbi:MAG: phosphotransacetylase family protein [Thermostichales cyanobacterium SZTDM-1c_bins_54]